MEVQGECSQLKSFILRMMLCGADVLTALNIPQCTFYLYMDKIHQMTFLFPLTCKVKKHNYQDH
jgi:hypothetical protein